MLQQPSHEIMSRPAQSRIALLVIEQRLPVLHKQHMYMHSAARLLIDGLGQERGCFSLFGRQILDNIFDNHGIVSHSGHVGQLHLDLHLAGASHLMVVVFHPDAPVLHHHAHSAAQVVSHILRRRHMIAPLVRHLVAVVSRTVQTVVPVRLSGVDSVSALSGRHLKAGAVKQIELEFRPYDHTVRNAALLHVLYRPKAHVLWILIKGLVLPLADGAYVSAHGQGGNLRKGIHIGRIRIRQEHHVAFLNGRVSVVGTVEADAVGEGILPEPFHRNGDMPPASIDISHLKIDHADLLFLTQPLDFLDFVHTPAPSFYSIFYASFRPQEAFA